MVSVGEHFFVRLLYLSMFFLEFFFTFPVPFLTAGLTIIFGVTGGSCSYQS